MVRELVIQVVILKVKDFQVLARSNMWSCKWVVDRERRNRKLEAKM